MIQQPRCLIFNHFKKFVAFAVFIGASQYTVAQEIVRVKERPKGEKITPFTLLFDPAKNGIQLEKQQIDYDLTNENALRVGPYFLNSEAVAMYLTKEQGEYYEVEFGLEVKRRIGPMYVASFRWPLDYIDQGDLELQNDKGEVLWKRKVTPKDISQWNSLVEEQRRKIKLSKDRLREIVESQSGKKGLPQKLDFRRPDTLSSLHSRSQFGFAHQGVFELPINRIKGPFRFCLSKDVDEGRIGLCSRRYEFTRVYGNFGIKTLSHDVRPRVLVNDKAVTAKGTAIFLDYETPIKFSALLKNGTYFEFVSRPKEIRLVDMVVDKENKRIQVIGFGDEPLGEVEKDFYHEDMVLGFLNFMPTIGDLRKFWRTDMPLDNPTLYLKGQGGVPFRQTFVFEHLPSTQIRAELKDGSQRATYSSRPTLKGFTKPGVRLGPTGGRVKRTTANDFEWEFMANQSGAMNNDTMEVIEDGRVYRVDYNVFRGYSAELSARTTGIITDKGDLVVLGEVAGQYWFEKLLGWDNYYLSKLRWGLSVKYFDTLLAEDVEGFKTLDVITADLKYRLNPGIWARDPTVGLIFATQKVKYVPNDEYTAQAQFLGGGLFWARSMPKIFDDIFNIVPFMRYPKWVDVEGILYPLILDSGKTSQFTLAVNFHGKIQWTPRFFGEAGFGLKNFAWEDTTIGDSGKTIGLGVAYATVGLGYNF